MNPVKHVAIIMDGNGRWGLKHKNSRNLGHQAGIKTIEDIIETCIKQKIKYLTLFAFSTDNWKRPKNEIDYLFKILEDYLLTKIFKLHRQNIKLKVFGKKKYSKKLNKLIIKAEKKTSTNDKLHLNVAIDYGSKTEIIDTIKFLNRNKISINEKNITNNLYTKNLPDPDLLIRTGNTKRLSNFLLWQLSYTEIFFIKKLWPDFKKHDFLKIIKEFKLIKRNYGSI